MNNYELTMLFSVEDDGKAKKEALKKLKEYVKKVNGVVVKENSWGVKDLAYTIKKQDTADYEHYVLEMDPKDQVKIDAVLRLEEGILRYLFVRV